MATHTSFESLAKTFDKYADNLYKSTEAKVKAIAQKAGEFIIRATPEDRGTAKHGWQTTLDRMPSSSNIDKREFPPVKGGLDAIQRNKDAVSMFKIGSNKRIYIVNYLDYVAELNRGWSYQAPANYVAGSVVAAITGTQHIKIGVEPYGGSYGK